MSELRKRIEEIITKCEPDVGESFVEVNLQRLVTAIEELFKEKHRELLDDSDRSKWYDSLVQRKIHGKYSSVKEYIQFLERRNKCIDDDVLSALREAKAKLALAAYHSGLPVDLSWIDHRIKELEDGQS